jgi:hypothetical protein
MLVNRESGNCPTITGQNNPSVGLTSRLPTFRTAIKVHGLPCQVSSYVVPPYPNIVSCSAPPVHLQSVSLVVGVSSSQLHYTTRPFFPLLRVVALCFAVRIVPGAMSTSILGAEQRPELELQLGCFAVKLPSRLNPLRHKPKPTTAGQ